MCSNYKGITLARVLQRRVRPKVTAGLAQGGRFSGLMISLLCFVVVEVLLLLLSIYLQITLEWYAASVK